MDTAQVGEVLEHLIQTLENGKKGFTETAKKLSNAGRGDLAMPLLDLAAQRAGFSAELRSIAAAQGIPIEESGSLGADLDQEWTQLGNTGSTDEPAPVLSAAETGESHAQQEFVRALEESLPEDIKLIVARQASAVTAAHDTVRGLRDGELG